jgi:hypothetical protein
MPLTRHSNSDYWVTLSRQDIVSLWDGDAADLRETPMTLTLRDPGQLPQSVSLYEIH